MEVNGMLIAILVGIALGYAILYWKKKKDAAGNASYQSGQSNQFQNQMPHGQQFQGQQFQGQQSGKFCHNCGKQIEVEAAFCPFCGSTQNM